MQALLEALPFSVTSLGLVDCSLHNEAGEALVAWLAERSSMTMVCVENNNFSDTVKGKIQRAGILGCYVVT